MDSQAERREDGEPSRSARKQWASVAFVAIAMILLVAQSAITRQWMPLILLALASGLIWWSWPGKRGPHTSHQAAQASASDDDVVVYWRPG